MAIYLINPISLTNVEILDIKFHKKLNLFAISVIKDSTAGNIFIADNNGAIFEDYTIKENQPSSCILWHPTKELLAVGWVDGLVSVYDASKNKRFDAPPSHVLPIASFAWSSHGSRLLSADIDGNLHCWRIDLSKGFGQAPLFTYQAACSINTIVLRAAKLCSEDVYDIRELAKAAVSGDQRALDLMRSSENSHIRFTGYSYVEVATFLAGLGDGRVILIDENGKVFNITSLDGSVVRMLYHEERDIFIATTDIGTLAHHQLLADNTSKEVMKVKLSCRTPNPSLIWAGPTTLAISLGENMLRMWDIDKEENYTLQSDEIMGYVQPGQIITVDYCYLENTLIAGTSNGQVVCWKLLSQDHSSSDSPETRWCLQPATNLLVSDTTIAGSVEKLVASSTNLVAVATSTHMLYLLEESPMTSYFNNGIMLQQLKAKEFVIQLYEIDSENSQQSAITDSYVPVESSYFHEPEKNSNIINKKKKSIIVAVEHAIKQMACTLENIVISDGKNIYSYDLDLNSEEIVKICGKFDCESRLLKVHLQNVYVYVNSTLQIRNFQGTVKQVVDTGGMDGDLTYLDINGNFMVCATNKWFMRAFDLSRREPKPLSPVKDVSESIPSVTQIRSVSINSNGKTVCLVIDRQRRQDSKLYFWDIENDNFQYFNFESGLGEQDDHYQNPLQSKQSQQQLEPSRSQRRRSAARSGRRSARTRNRRRRQMQEKGGINAQGDTFAVTQSILYDTSNSESDVDDADVQQNENERVESVSPSSNLDDYELGNGVAFKEIYNTKPMMHLWDKLDPRIIVAVVIPQNNKHGHNMVDMTTAQITSLFVTQEDGIMVFDCFPIPTDCFRLIGFDAPYFYFSTRIDTAYQQRTTESVNNNSFIVTRTMRDFQGLENFEQVNKTAILNFSYYLTTGNMDEAFKAMKLIKSEQIWHNMARMCVKTRRLDVATVCLGRMNFGRAAMHLREAKFSIQEVDAKIAMLALQLDMKKEAIELLQKSARYDILNDLYQAMAEWDKAIDIAETHDRIHLKTTYYNYAKYLEEEKHFSQAVKYYIKSGTHAFEVPRMLLDDPEELKKFIKERPEKSVKRWWAQYMECCNNMEEALQYYEASQDYLSLVRAYWYLGKEQRALDICNETGDAAACYHTARQFEAREDIDKAVHYFTRARAYNNAIRVCQEHGRDDHLVNLALLAKPDDQIAAACYLQKREGYQDKAVMLFHKAGQIGRAIDLAFRSRQFGALQYISADLSEKADPAMVQKCAAFFMENNQFDRAVDLLASNKQLWDALKLCVEYNVPMTEELSEKLTPDRQQNPQPQSDISTISGIDATPSQYTETERGRLLEGVAEIALNQRQYHIACKKFTQAGNQIQAVKALLKSGDTQKIIFFANVAKNVDVYVLAANYLQTLDSWRQDPEISKNIVQFYTRGKAPERLAAFFEARAQSEIEDCQNYKSALTNLGEAHKYWNKVKFSSEDHKNRKIDEIRDRCTLIQNYTIAIQKLEQDPESGLQHLQMLLDDPGLERGVRYGDVYATMIRYFMHEEKYKAAYSCLEEMKTRVTNPPNVLNYIDVSVLKELHAKLNIPFRSPASAKGTKYDSKPDAANVKGNNNLDNDKDSDIDDDNIDDTMDDIIDDQVAAAIDEDLG